MCVYMYLCLCLCVYTSAYANLTPGLHNNVTDSRQMNSNHSHSFEFSEELFNIAKICLNYCTMCIVLLQSLHLEP